MHDNIAISYIYNILTKILKRTVSPDIILWFIVVVIVPYVYKYK